MLLKYSVHTSLKNWWKLYFAVTRSVWQVTNISLHPLKLYTSKLQWHLVKTNTRSLLHIYEYITKKRIVLWKMFVLYQRICYNCVHHRQSLNNWLHKFIFFFKILLLHFSLKVFLLRKLSSTKIMQSKSSQPTDSNWSRQKRPRKYIN